MIELPKVRLTVSSHPPPPLHKFILSKLNDSVEERLISLVRALV